MRYRRTSLTFILTLLALLALPLTVGAGGWSVVTLDSSPVNLQPGVPFTVGFVVRQHGVTPLGGLTPNVTLTNAATNERVTARATAEGATGHYVVTLTLPATGAWNWQIDAFGPPAVLSPIQVGATASAPATAPARFAWATWPALALLAALSVVSVGALVLARTRRTRLAVRA